MPEKNEKEHVLLPISHTVRSLGPTATDLLSEIVTTF